jgi:hypothetical protein
VSEDPARVRARKAHRESLGAATRGSDEQVAVGHAVRVDAHVEEPLAAQGDQGSGSPLQREQLAA